MLVQNSLEEMVPAQVEAVDPEIDGEIVDNEEGQERVAGVGVLLPKVQDHDHCEEQNEGVEALRLMSDGQGDEYFKDCHHTVLVNSADATLGEQFFETSPEYEHPYTVPLLV